MDIFYILMIVLGFILSSYFNSYKTYHLKQKNQELKNELSNFIQKNLSLESKLKENDNYKDVPIHDIYEIKSDISNIYRVIKSYDKNFDVTIDLLKENNYMTNKLYNKFKD